MRLVRLVNAQFRPRLRALERRQAIIGGVRVTLVEPNNAENEATCVPLLAEIDTRSPTFHGGACVLPESDLRAVQAALETVVGAIASLNGSASRLTSPSPCVGLIPADAHETRQLHNSRGILSRRREFERQVAPLDPVQALGALADRTDGVAYLTSALTAETGIARCLLLLRLFGTAFASSPDRLANLLPRFLTEVGIGEVREWLVFGRRSWAFEGIERSIFPEATAWPMSFRMEAAAYDVLLNKRAWHSKTMDRRVQPDVRMISVHTWVSDDCGAYPLDSCESNGLPHEAFTVLAQKQR